MGIKQFPQANPVLQKISLRLNLAGAGPESPILSGLGGTITLQLGESEILRSWRIFSGDPDNPDFENEFTVVGTDDPATQDIIFGTDTATGTEAVRNVLEFITDRGTTHRQFWVKDLPDIGSLYIGNQEAQGGSALFSIANSTPITFGINVLPNFGDEFFRIGELDANRWANTLRTWGGACTAEVFIDGGLAIEELYIGDLHGWYWPTPSGGDHEILVTLRSEFNSVHTVDITGTITIEYV